MENDAVHIVHLDRDHPGFRDPVYRARRNQIAAIALQHRRGQAVRRVDYTAAEHEVWRTAARELGPLHAELACREFLAEYAGLGLPGTSVPQLEDLNARIAAATGFRFEPVAGLVTPSEFMTHLADGVFLATQYLRHGSTPLYTPEPDVIHEIIGHAPLLMAPRFAALNRLFGEAARGADEARTQALIRLYWYTLEFGLVREAGALKVVGAGLFSSFGELRRLAQVPQRPLVIDEIVATDFDPTDYQRVYFVADGTDELLATVAAWLRRG